MIKEITERASRRSYLDKKIPDCDIKTILEAGRLAPSWMNVQCWHFISVSDEETKALLSELSFGQPHVKSASHVIVCIADTTAWDSEKFRKVLQARGTADEQIDALFQNPALYPKIKGDEKVLLRTVEQCTYPISYMNLEAENLGIASCIIGAIGNELTESNNDVYLKVREKLNIPEKMYIMAFITLGYDAKPDRTIKRIRKPFNEVVSQERFGKEF